MPPSISKSVTLEENLSDVRQRKSDCNDNPVKTDEDGIKSESSTNYTDFKPEIRWPDLIVQIFIHVGALYGFYLLFSVKLYSLIWCEYLIYLSALLILSRHSAIFLFL
ncbi:hypothetical protein DMENIID0001_120940 [Sergentomyia squamirostris]